MNEEKPLYHNLMEDVVLRYVDGVMAASGCCTCALCRADIIAYALNQLPPRYVRTEAGRMMVEVSSYAIQFRADVLSALGEAVQLIQKNPHH